VRNAVRDLICALLLAWAAAAGATPGESPVLLYRGAGQGKVVFDGRLHASKGFVCNDCHLTLFATRKRALISMADHRSGTSCFACHDATRAFSECSGCHRQ